MGDVTIGQKLFELINPYDPGASCNPAQWHQVDEDWQAHYERAATAFLDLCQAKSSAQGETVSAPAEPLQADLVADAALMKALGSAAWLADQEHRKDHHESTLIAVGLLRELRDGYQRIAERRNKESDNA